MKDVYKHALFYVVGPEIAFLQQPEIGDLARVTHLLYGPHPMKRIPSHAVIVVFTTVPKRSDAIRLSRVIVKKKISACATVLPGVRSFYHWERKMVEEKEVLIIFKTTMRRYPAVEKTIKALHPYEVPEILAVQIKNGYSPYLAWVSKEVGN